MAKGRSGASAAAVQAFIASNPNSRTAQAAAAPAAPKANTVRSAGPVLSKNEAVKIADATNKTVAQVMAKAQEKGAALGAGLVNQFNAGKLGPNTSSLVNVIGNMSVAPGQSKGTSQALQQLQALQGLRMNKGTAYAGYSTTNNPAYSNITVNGGSTYVPGSTTYNPIVLPRGMVRSTAAAAAGGGAGGGGKGGAGNAGAGGAGGVKNDGTIESIKALYEEQMAAARAEMEKYASMQAEQINAMQLNFADQLAASQSAADQEIAYLNDLMMMQSQQASQTQSLLEQQNQAAQAAYAEQARAAAALGKAFVPTLEPTAASVQLGDQRQTQRNELDNSLSSLAITSSLGSNSNPLAGLQLA